MSDHHFFASTYRGWAVASTRDGALRKVAQDFSAEELRKGVQRNGKGVLAYTIRVDLPQSAEYDINGYAPVGVPTDDRQMYRITGRRSFKRVEG